MSTPAASVASNECAVLTATELKRLQSLMRNGPEPNERTLRKKVLHEQCLERTKNWNDSVTAIQKRKEIKRKEKEEQLEAARKKVDEEEDALAVKHHREIIQKTRQAFLRSDDIVRTFDSQLLLSEVMKEREAQISLRGRVEAQRHEVAEQEHQQLLKRIEAQKEAELQKEKVERKKAARIAQERKEQLQMAVNSRLESRRATLIDGIEANQRSTLEVEAEEKAEDERRATARKLREENDRMGIMLKELKKEADRKLTEEEALIEGVARLREENQETMQKRRDELSQNEANRRENCYAQLSKTLQSQQVNREVIFAKQIEDEERRIAEREAREKAEKERARKHTEKMRQIQMQRLVTAKKEEVKMAAKRDEDLRTLHQQLIAQEQAEIALRKENSRKFALLQHRQAERHANLVQGEQSAQTNEEQAAIERAQERDEELAQYTLQEMELAQRRGLALGPLVVGVNKDRRLATFMAKCARETQSPLTRTVKLSSTATITSHPPLPRSRVLPSQAPALHASLSSSSSSSTTKSTATASSPPL